MQNSILPLLLFGLVCGLDFRARADAYVRFNQAGYITTTNKTAILLASGTESGTFSLISVATGSNVYSAAIPATSLGSWSTNYPDTYTLDFSPVTNAGKYLIQVAATINTTSMPVVIDTASNMYSSLLTNALFYYQSSRDGPNVITNVINRKRSHLFDTNAITYVPPYYADGGVSDMTFTGGLTNTGGSNIDASGGWFDAGDYIKLVETTSYVEGMMLFALRDYPNRMAAAGNFSGEAQYGLNFLLRMWDQTNKILYYQVSIGDGNVGGSISGDHDVWRLPEQDDLTNLTPSSSFYYAQYRRPAFRYGPGNTLISPNLAGRLAADFALASQCFRVTNVALANQCLLAAQTIFDLASTNWGTAQLVTASPFNYYPEGSWHDDMEWGAAELYFATAQTNLAGLTHSNALYYLTNAAYWANQYNTSDNGSDTLNLYDTSAVAHYELYRAISQAGNPGGLAISQATLLSGIASQLASGVKAAGKNPFSASAGTSYDDDPVPHALGFSITANLYRQLTGSNTYDSFSQAQTDWVLGKNPWGTTFIVGDGYTFPHCMQDQIANLAGSTNGTLPLRLGATTDGPYGKSLSTSFFDNATPCNDAAAFTPFNGSKAVYVDADYDWASVEPALDYTVDTVVLFAQVMGEISNNATAPAPLLTSSAHHNNSTFSFNLSGGTGFGYIIQATTNPVTTNWTAIYTNTSPFGFTDSVAGSFSNRFYRAVSHP